MKRRMSKTSRQNVESAERAVIEKSENGYMVRLEKGISKSGIPSFSAYISSPESPMLYPSVALARRAVQGIKPDMRIEYWEPVAARMPSTGHKAQILPLH